MDFFVKTKKRRKQIPVPESKKDAKYYIILEKNKLIFKKYHKRTLKLISYLNNETDSIIKDLEKDKDLDSLDHLFSFNFLP